MGKKVVRKSRAAAKEKRAAAQPDKSAPQPSNDVESYGIGAVEERKPCGHLDRDIDLDKFSVKFGSSDPIRCEDCLQGANDRRGRKGKGKHGKKKGGASADSKSDSKAIWVCLDCGHYACGGVGLPTTPQSHAVRHAKQAQHPLVIQWENSHLWWCFLCNTLIPVEKTEENGENKDELSEVVKLMKGRSTKGSSVDVKDVWFGSGSVTSEIKSEGILPLGDCFDGKAGYVVRGLTNLGSTCFFNSVVQNLLAMGRFRDYFLNMDVSFGPLTIALKKLFAETKPEVRNVINPKSFFGCVCSKAPQFSGYQQHDSHELLRCLLDGLCTEELDFRKIVNASEESGISSNQGPTFVDSVFGGQISSTVCCVECGSSSTVYEQFLDLSLPVPTKKPPPKIAQPSRAKKTKPTPKKSGKVQCKANKDIDTVTVQNPPSPAAISESPCVTQSTAPPTKKVAVSSSNSSLSGSVSSSTMAAESIPSQNFSAVAQPENEQVLDNSMDQTVSSFDDFTWLDYLEPESMLNGHDLNLQSNDLLFQDSGDKDKVSGDISMEISQIPSLNDEQNSKPDSSSVNPRDDELPVFAQASEVILLPYNEENSTTGEMMNGDAEAYSLLVGCGEEELDFDGFGGLFNEPEIAARPVAGSLAGPSLGGEGMESGFLVGNSSESDPEEVDNSSSTVSVESCLAHFIKPELLTDDNAWDCESCSRTLQCQTLETSKKQAKLASQVFVNGGETKKPNDLKATKDLSFTSEVKTLSNGDMKTEIDLDTSGESLVLHNGKSDCLNQTCAEFESGQTCEINPVVSHGQEGKKETSDAVPGQSQSSGVRKSGSQESFGYQVEDCQSADKSGGSGTADGVQSNEEINSLAVKVKRDATKRVLINNAPPILTVHLKRFSQDTRGRLSKLNGHVNFSEMINLRPYTDPRCTDQEKYDYRLVGVVEHLGTIRGGHYVAYVRGAKIKGKQEKENEGCVWYHASDAYVRESSLEEVLRCEAYILFYEQL
ncbi:ubiquitin carboxyl-terminal hydrolase 2-like [Mangifera indica]|uniref:ubiquitin carboxyl-terminal hydrolase 2-like n=1 Tax=Mangifera indica TaxID=29780 RepID=UPI001CFAE736|nr:ubiquitin carboxyl-terminal hydrolase 2-like [Mangifera indica]